MNTRQTDAVSVVSDRKTVVIINRESRNGALMQPSANPGQIADLLESAGIMPAMHWIAPAKLPVVLREVAADQPPSVIIGGGDGTVNAAAEVFAGTSTVVGILPLGTFNHLAKDLRIPMRLPQAVRALVEGQVSNIDLGRMNGKVFVNHATIGLYPHVVSKRKAYQRTLGVGRFSAMSYALVQALFRRPAVQLDFQHARERQRMRTPFVFVGNNRFETSPFSFIRRQTLDEGHLHVLYVPQLPTLMLLKIAVSAVFGGLRSVPELQRQWQPSVTITSRHHNHLNVSLDGEVWREATPLEFRSWPRALRVITPSPDA